MNNNRRKEIRSLIESLTEIQQGISDIAADEQEYFDNMPENFQDGERGEAAQAAISQLEDAEQSIDDLMAQLEEAAA